MNFYLLRTLGKWLSIIVLFVLLLFNIKLADKQYNVSNVDKNDSILTEVVEYETIKHYDSSIPKNIQKTVIKGQNGLVYKDENGESVILQPVINEEITIGTGKHGEYNGIITGYGPDCKTCSGEGYVYCRTREKTDFNIIKQGIYYEDIEYGDVRVLAAAISEFPCGTIVEVESNALGKFTGIVLDTGYDMRKHLEQGIYHFDVAYMTENDEMVPKTTDMSGKVSYSIQRWGW